MENYESFAVKLKTVQGYDLVAGGICKTGYNNFWVKQFNSMRELRITLQDVYTIDYNIAKTLKKISNSTILLAGCSLKAQVILPHKTRTGGVLGSPHVDIESAEGCTEKLPFGFNMYTVPGGPGVAALASEVVLKRIVEKIFDIKTTEINENTILGIFDAEKVTTGLLVCDGIGDDTRGCLAALSSVRRQVLIL